MHTNLLLENLIAQVLQEISTQGLCVELNRQYKRIYSRFKAFARRRNTDSYSPDLIRWFITDIEQQYMSGGIGRSRRSHLRRASLLLKDFVEFGQLEWKHYTDSTPVPLSQSLLLLYSQYIDHLKSSGKSDNTIQSSRNYIRQFLLFLEDSGCKTLSTVPPNMLPSFFQHLLATHAPTSICTVASHIRSFLKFTEGGERLVPLVPSRCARNKPIIPILTEIEREALNSILKSVKVSFRDKAIIQLALRTGLRAVDIVGIKLSDIDWINDTISILQLKTGKPFNIPLTADVGNVLSSYILKERPKAEDPQVFLRSVTPFRPLCGHSACYAIVRKVFHHAGIRLSNERKGIHVLRHSAASMMLSKGVPVTTISSMLGHSNKSSTDVYLATDEIRMRECALPLSGIPAANGGLT